MIVTPSGTDESTSLDGATAAAGVWLVVDAVEPIYVTVKCLINTSAMEISSSKAGVSADSNTFSISR